MLHFILSKCFKSRSGCCIYIHVASIYFQVFSDVSYVCLEVFHLNVAYVCNGFQMFLCIFTSVLDACFKCFICLFLYVAIILSKCFKVDPVLNMGCSWRHGRRLGWRGPTAHRYLMLRFGYIF